eukprot:CFRG4867T1
MLKSLRLDSLKASSAVAVALKSTATSKTLSCTQLGSQPQALVQSKRSMTDIVYLKKAAYRKSMWKEREKMRAENPELEKSARLMQERIEFPDPSSLSMEELIQAYNNRPQRQIMHAAYHHRIMQHMFPHIVAKGDTLRVNNNEVFSEYFQNLRVSYGKVPEAEVTADKKSKKKSKKEKVRVFNVENNVYLGNILKPAHAQTKPTVSYEGDEDSLYTLVLSSPDDNFYENEKETLHWMVANVPGTALEQGVEVCEYLPPTPLAGIGHCRYVFALYEQMTGVSEGMKTHMIPGLSTFSTPEFMETQKTTLVGLSFMQCEHDSSVGQTLTNIVDVREPLYKASSE